MGKLTALKVKALTEPGSYIDGDGPMLVVGSSGGASWKLRATIAGKRRDIGVGSLKVLSLADARAKAGDLRRQIAQGIDPIAERRKVVDPVPTFRDAAKRHQRLLDSAVMLLVRNMRPLEQGAWVKQTSMLPPL